MLVIGVTIAVVFVFLLIGLYLIQRVLIALDTTKELTEEEFDEMWTTVGEEK